MLNVKVNMIRITVDKNGKNIKLHYDDNAHKLNEYTQFFKEHMSNLRQILRLYAQGESKLKISELTGLSRNTLKKYLKI